MHLQNIGGSRLWSDFKARRVSRSRSIRSRKSGEMIIFQSRGSPAFGQGSRTSGGATPPPWPPKAQASWSRIALSRVM